MSSLDNLRKSAKRWLKALRAGDFEAWERLRRTYSKAVARPGLRDIQQALARERGYAGWTVLKRALENQPTTNIEFTGGRTHAERVATFLEFACWDHHVHGRGDHRMHDRAAARLLEQHPEIVCDSIYTAAVCGELEEVHRILAERPAAACESGGARGWTPLLYLCYARFSYPPTIENALAIAGALLDHGANPNDYDMAGDSHYTALVGAAGEGEQDSPRQPQGPALFQLLLERGAEPFDVQVLYNTHFSGDVLWWLEMVYAHTMKIGRTAEWADPDWKMLDMGAYGCGARFLLGIALRKRDLRLAEWLLAHGANPNAAPARDRRHSKRSLYEDAVRSGSPQMAELLARYGAITAMSALSDQEQFQDACFRWNESKRGLCLPSILST